MSFGILGKKIGMTQIFDLKGNAVPVTIVNSGPCFISQIKTNENSGYIAVQLAFSEIYLNNKSLTKPLRGHFEKSNIKYYRYLKEFKVKNSLKFKLGQKISLSLFNVGEYVNAKALTIGKGNASNIKKNKFKRGPMSHGSKHHRLQGSLGAGTSPGRVFPGKKMPGRLGSINCTIKNLEILLIDKINNFLIIKGSIPGKRGSLVKLSATKENL